MRHQAGIMEEMLDDVMDMEDDEELEEEADAEVEKVLYEITDGKLGAIGSVNSELPVSGVLFYHDARLKQLLINKQAEQDKVDEEAERNLAEYQIQLSDLLSG